MTAPEGPDITAIFADGTAIAEAIKRVVREAVLRRKRLGQSVCVWRDGRVVEIGLEEIAENE
jgi:hypothetical protein